VRVTTFISRQRDTPILANIRFPTVDSVSSYLKHNFLCAQLCVRELPSLDYTREIGVFEPASSPSEAATFELYRWQRCQELSV